ncbi:hypothetical protein FB45DRAFT_820721 [Roridomyces roridus]|uniref:Uncharacterized protein n=1 Tax=Roridomyces roridus TaxID=1738132 RepID=A0AAD7G399_9AGAR|nr:hypothetical protein FB45DRAFT_820721 [Roridomyces roridus]
MPHLPDEIVSEILSPALKVPEELFSDTSEPSPFANFTPSTSSYLLVCKDWLRVGTPLLYNVVVLRSKAQANALAVFVQKNPEFGRFIKKLRVEGGFGQSMHAILKAAPNITDLFLSLRIWSSDNTSGLCKGLPLVNPNRVIVVDQYWGVHTLENKQNEALRKTLISCVQSWSNLRVFGFPYGHSNSRAQELSDALSQSQVHTVQLNECFYDIPPFIHTLCRASSLKSLQFREVFRVERLKSTIEGNAQLRKVAQLPKHTKPEAIAEPDIAPSLNPHFVPMECATEEVRECVWKRVLFFAMYVEELRSPEFPRRPSESHPSRLALLRVSRYFYRLGLPHLYDCVVVKSRNANSIRRLLKRRPQLGSFVLRIFANYSGTTWGTVGEEEVSKAIISLCHYARHLQVLELAPVDFAEARQTSVEVLELSSRNAGRTLERLSISIEPDGILPQSMGLFTPLRELSIGGERLQCAPDLALPPESFPSLEVLRLRTDTSGVLLGLFADLKLGSLRTFSLPPTIPDKNTLSRFFAAHGEKLLHLIAHRVGHLPNLSECPNVLAIEILRDCNPGKLIADRPHPSLAKIIVSGMSAALSTIKLDTATFPALREIQIRCLEWPATTETYDSLTTPPIYFSAHLEYPQCRREISMCKIIPFAESLLEQNIKVTSWEGKPWVPRLKIVTKRPGKVVTKKRKAT